MTNANTRRYRVVENERNDSFEVIDTECEMPIVATRNWRVAFDYCVAINSGADKKELDAILRR